MRAKSRELKDRILSVIEQTANRGGNCPTYRYIADELNVNASTIYRYMLEMESDGEVLNGEFGFMTAAMSGANSETVAVAVVGNVPCGSLTEEFQSIDGYVRLPVSLVGRGEFFMLKAYGDSMVGAGIDDGDMVLIRRCARANDGDIVVALVDGEVTLKRFYIDKAIGAVRLHPENETMSDIIVPSCEIQGVAVKVFKDLV